MYAGIKSLHGDQPRCSPVHLLRPAFMSLLSSRGEPIQFGSSQLLFPEWLRRVGLVGALIALSYI